MGIYDREYYRREGPSFLGAITSTGQVCKWLILVNVLVFVVQLLTPRPDRGMGGVTRDEKMLLQQRLQLTQPEWDELEDGKRKLSKEQHEQVQQALDEIVSRRHQANEFASFTDALLLNPNAVLHGQLWRLLTYAFLHDPNSLLHILFNMLFLWWFGSDLESMYGQREFLAFYLIAAVAGAVAFVVWALLGTGPMPVCLGASGAVTAVMVLYALHFPTRLIYIWFILPVPIWLFVLFQVAQDSFFFLGGIRTTTAVTVHLGGAAFGLLYYKLHWRLTNLLPDLRSWQRARGRPRLRVYREDEGAPAPVSVPAAPANPVDEHLEAKVDAVLEKVARHGKESLTDSERQLLLRASEIYKRRRS